MPAPVEQLGQQLTEGNPANSAVAAETLAQLAEDAPPEWFIEVYDKLWRPAGGVGDFIEASGAEPTNELPSATIKLKGDDPLVETMMGCRDTMVGVTVETAGQRFAFYVDTHDYEFDDNTWTSTANLLGIYDILNYLVVWPDWWLPIQAQLFSHAIFIGPLVTVIETMIAECALRIQSGLNEFINNAGSLNPDIRAWFGTLLANNGNIFQALKTPLYVVRTNPLLDTSPLYVRTVRMETCGAVIKDITRAYGIDVRVNLWMPGDPQPDPWAFLTQPTYIVTVKDRSQIEGPTKTVADSVIRTVVDVEGSLLGKTLEPLLNPAGQYHPERYPIAPVLGVNFVAPWVLVIAPEPDQPGSVDKCKISDHTPKGWQHIIGGRSPKWLNDILNATYGWIIDSIMILIGITGISGNLLSGFLNNAFLAFQLIEHYQRRADVGPYHPAIEVFHATSSAPYNLETLFAFINALWDSRGWTSAQFTFRNGHVYTYGKDILPGALVSLVYMRRTKMLTDHVTNVIWRIDENSRDITLQVGDGKAKESPLAKHQRFITGLIESLNVLLLTPQSGG